MTLKFKTIISGLMLKHEFKLMSKKKEIIESTKTAA